MAQKSKAYRAAVEKIEDGKYYTPNEAVALAKETGSAKFDSTVEVALKLGVDPRKADQMVRGTVILPHGTGKTARVIVFATGPAAEAAIAAGADEVGGAELIEKVAGGLHRVRLGRLDPRAHGPGRSSRQGARPPRPHAQPEDRHRDPERGQGRLRHQGRQDRVPRRQARQRALRRRQGRRSRSSSSRRTPRPRSKRSCASSRRAPRAVTSRRAPCRPRSAPASRWTSTPSSLDADCTKGSPVRRRALRRSCGVSMRASPRPGRAARAA